MKRHIARIAWGLAAVGLLAYGIAKDTQERRKAGIAALEQKSGEAPGGAPKAAVRSPGGHSMMQEKTRPALPPQEPPATGLFDWADIYVIREPRQPGESGKQYERRVDFIRGLDAFLAEADLSPEQEELLLRALLDYQDFARIVWEEALGGPPDETNQPHLLPWSRVKMLAYAQDEFVQRVRKILDPEQHRQWQILCNGCYSRLAYGRPLLEMRLRDDGDGRSE